MAAPLEISGKTRTRFVLAAVLLHLLDPVRGEPTSYSLDQDLEFEAPRERLLKRKFLDSFALVCATRKDGDSVSAACMEEGAPEGTIIRVASNSGVSERTLSQLEALVKVLNDIASLSPIDGETEILKRIIRLDITKIRCYLKDLRAAKDDVFEEHVSAVESRIIQALGSASDIDYSTLQRFLEWFGEILTIRAMPPNSEPDPESETLVHILRWAQQARKYYLDILRAAFSTKVQSLPRWVCMILKLGRYGIACRAFVQLAFEFPALLNPLIVKPVKAPLKKRFTVPEGEMPLTSILRRAVGGHAEEYLQRLASIWGTADVEGHFRRACSLDLSVHAETQLVNFYEHNRECKPSLRFIGVSKKSCYLCHLFLANHPESFSISSCHQKLYPSWIPPPAISSSIYKQLKTITTELSKRMESTAKQELQGRLGSPRRHVPAESTAGVSLSGLTELAPARMGTQVFVGNRNTRREVDIVMDETAENSSPLQPIEVVNLTSSISETGLTAFSDIGTPVQAEGSLDGTDATLTSRMVFHFMRADDTSKQDIISVTDTVDHFTNRPSWTKLLGILKSKDRYGVAFKEEVEFLVFNYSIRVANERQFLACVQYLLNSNTWNSVAIVYSETFCARMT